MPRSTWPARREPHPFVPSPSPSPEDSERTRTDASSHILIVLSSDAVARYLELPAHATSEIPSSCPSRALSNAPVSTSQMRQVPSADDVASHKPSGENLTLEMAFLCPLSTNLHR